MKSCKTCALWNRKQAADKIGRIRKDSIARCLWESTEPWPESVGHERRPWATNMRPSDGIDCPCWKAIEAE